MPESSLEFKLPGHVKVALTLAAITGFMLMCGPSTLLFMSRSLMVGLFALYIYGHWFVIGLIACYMLDFAFYVNYKKVEPELFGLKHLSIAFLVGLAGHLIFGMYVTGTTP